MCPAQVGFPGAAQAAVLRRDIEGRQPETVWLLTSRPQERLDATTWLSSQRKEWGIENGLHQPLDVTADEDRSRVTGRQGALLLGFFRRLANSVSAEWRSREPTRQNQYLPDFFCAMSQDCFRRAFATVTSRKPTL